MFLLDSLMISGIQWALKTVVTAAEAEMNDDSALRDQLLEAEMKREMGEISEDEFAGIEADLLQRIREIKERRDGGSGALAFGAQPIETSADSRFQVEAELSGDYHETTTPVVGSARSSRVDPGRVPATARVDAGTRTARRPRTVRTTRTTRTRKK